MWPPKQETNRAVPLCLMGMLKELSRYLTWLKWLRVGQVRSSNFMTGKVCNSEFLKVLAV